MVISIIVPTLNEVNHIDNLIESIYTLDSIPKEIVIVDGGSVDGTIHEITRLKGTYPNLKLVKNPKKYVSHGFNKAFHASDAPFVSLVGAHAKYPANYFSSCIEAINSGECEVAGGILVQKGKTITGKAIAIVMSSKLGVGDTPFRTKRKRMYVDSVAFAVYGRKVFENCGLLDEQLIRNQDDEFHYRLNRAGYRIMMLPELKVEYYVRDSFKKLFVQYYQYGYYKPMVLRKVATGIRMRHFIPALFVSYLITLPLSFFFPYWLIPLGVYCSICFGFAISIKAQWNVRARVPLVFPVLHVAYGFGFLRGLMK